MTHTQSSDIYIGLMSGTSLDGVDVAIVDFTRYPPTNLYQNTLPYPADLRQCLRELIHSQASDLDDLSRIDAELAEIYARAIQHALHHMALKPGDIAAVGCHGQTVRHHPQGKIPYTVQLGDPGRLAALCGISTVADFRRKDIALGGQGAPLAPAYHRFLFHSHRQDRAVVNIGGIANVTILPANKQAPVSAFDTGPGNTLLDHWVREHRKQDFDDNGNWARGGTIMPDLLDSILATEPYFGLVPPKSTGTEYFSPAWLESWFNQDMAPQDIQATLTELTALTIARAINTMPANIHACFVCGGGAHNQFLLERLQTNLGNIKIAPTTELNVDPDFVEAGAFAWLARCRLQGTPVNLTEFTGARRAAVLGGLYLPD